MTLVHFDLTPTDHDDLATMTFTGYDTMPDGVLIASDTNPWVEVDGKPVDWTTVELPRTPCPCDEDHMALAPGVIDAMDTEHGIQQCDASGLDQGDLEAAIALARLVGGVVKFHVEPA